MILLLIGQKDESAWLIVFELILEIASLCALVSSLR